jgi:hypothetical protein
MEIDFESLKKALHDIGEWNARSGERAWSKFTYSDEFATRILAQLALNQQVKTLHEKIVVRDDPTPSDTEYFTQSEIAEAFKRLNYTSYKDQAQRIVANIKAHREPEWKEGDVVQAQNGVIYRRHNGTWLRFGFAGNVRHDIPLRPLKHLGKDFG